MVLKNVLLRISGKKFKPLKSKTRWQDNPQFLNYIKTEICPNHETGVHGAIRTSVEKVPLRNGISVGSGTGDNERNLILAGLVEKFDLFEVSADRIKQSKYLAKEAGVLDCITHHLADAFTYDFEEKYDIVYWEHSLHHMFDVDKALEWSVRALKDGGFLVVNDYIGPNRLQWRDKEVDLVRNFLLRNKELIGVDIRKVKRGSFFRHFKQFLRDPSEAPQSDKILDAYKKHTGSEMKILGGSVIHLSGGFITGLEKKDSTIHQKVINLDKHARDQGLAHFAFGIWRKQK